MTPRDFQELDAWQASPEGQRAHDEYELEQLLEKLGKQDDGA